MNGNTLNKLAFAAMIVLAMGCKTKKAVVVVPPTDTTTAVSSKKIETLKMLKEKDMVFNTLSIKAKATLDINGNVNNVTMNFRMVKGEKIWVSITAFAGIEVARALITPDSIKVKNSFQGVYLKKPFSYVHTYTNKQVNFALLQSIFSGNTIDDFMVEQSDLEQQDGVWVLKGEQGDLAYNVLFNTLFKIGQTNLNDVKSGKALKVVYGDYQKIDDVLVPSNIKISSMAGTQKIGLTLDFSKIERNVPLDFPFNVPTKYEVIN
ncbi:DUF4292 domain-containing protein [Pedobacter frigoris]|uniref:DUF4292 domain-containing protein n=1 Tax=Pedobacter frigoris TaxID=2571272 RepID=A0A4U1CD82_9SPHI|nr:DUF4292 domain-containing protein [Pedobacter frigoris]TKC04154.1 DUF4292 domain-containing protein [Pedobacter frigoris]